MVEHEEAVDQPHHEVHGVLDDDDGLVLRRQAAQHREHLFRLGLAEAGERLVEQQQARLPGERARELHQAQLLAGELARHALRDRGQADALDRLAGEPARLGVGRRAHVGADHHVVRHRHAHERTHDLEGAAHAELADLVRLQAEDAAPIEQHVARARRDEAVQQVERRGLARAVGADDAEDHALADAEADVVDRLEAAEVLRQTAHFEDDLIGNRCGAPHSPEESFWQPKPVGPPAGRA